MPKQAWKEAARTEGRSRVKDADGVVGAQPMAMLRVRQTLVPAGIALACAPAVPPFPPPLPARRSLHFKMPSAGAGSNLRRHACGPACRRRRVCQKCALPCRSWNLACAPGCAIAARTSTGHLAPFLRWLGLSSIGRI